MRAAIYTMSFVILVLAGFLLTPGVFNVINPEYLLALHQYGAPLEELRRNIVNNDLAITNLDDEIASLQKDQAEQSIAATAQQTALSAANASAQDIAQAAIKEGAKLASTKSRSRKSAQDDKWSFCLTAGTLCPTNQERQ